MCILGGVASQNIVVSLQKHFACKFLWHISKTHEMQQQQLEMLGSFPQSTCSLLPADGLCWAQRRWSELCQATAGQKRKEPSQQMRNVSFSPPFLGWWNRSTRKASKSLHDHSKNSTKVPKHRTRYILVVTKNISVTACHTSSFKPKIYHLLRTPARWQQIYHGAVNNLLIWAVKCGNTRSLKIYCSFRNHKFCWLFLT